MSHTHNPLEQFLIKPLLTLQVGGYDISFTNSSLLMLTTVTFITSFLYFSLKEARQVPNRAQMLAELSYQFIAKMLFDNVGKEGKKYIPFIFSLFTFIMVCNLLGMIPYSFTVTSHIIITFALAMLVFTVVTLVGFIRHGFHFLSLFMPQGTPLWLAPLIVVIELFAYLARPVSLSLRLAANMTAGHVLIKVIAGFIVTLAIWFKPLPFPLVVVLIGFEIFIALLQAYIFAVLSCVYLNDAVNLH